MMHSARFSTAYRFATGSEYHRSRQQFPLDSVVMVTSGVFFSIDTDGDVQEATAGDILYFRAGLAHESWNDPARPTRGLRLVFEHRGAAAAWPKCLHDAEGRIRIVGQWLMHAQQTRPRASQDVCDHYLHAICGEYERLLAQPEDSLVRRVHGYIQRHLHTRISLDDLARHVGLSRYHFLRRYKAIVGDTPMRTVQRMRMQEARRQIISTRLALKEIAQRVGLTDECHLSRLLRQHYGCTSRELRAAGTASWEVAPTDTTAG